MLDGNALNGKKRYVDANRAAFILMIAIAADLIVVQFGLVLIVSLIATMMGTGIDYYLSMVLNLCIQISFLVVIHILMKKRRLVFSPKLKDTSAPRIKSTAINSAIGIVGVIVCLFCFISAAVAFDLLLQRLGFDLGDSFFSLTDPGHIAATFFVVVIAAPICEELLFRGVLLSGMKKSGFKDLTCVLLTGLAFSLMHMNPAQTVYQFALGCAIAYITLKSGSLIPAIVMHAANNGIALAMELGQLNIFDEMVNFVFSSPVIAIVMTILLTAVGAVACYGLGRLCEIVVKKYHGSADLELDHEPDELVMVPTYAAPYPYQYAHNVYINNNAPQSYNPQQGAYPPQGAYNPPQGAFGSPQYGSQQSSFDANPQQTGYGAPPNPPQQGTYGAPNPSAQQGAYGVPNPNPQQGAYGMANPYGYGYGYGYPYPSYTYVPKNIRDPKGKRNFGTFLAVSLVVCASIWVVQFFAYAFLL